MNNNSELPEGKEEKEAHIKDFDQLATLGSVEFGEGKEVSFQPWGRYDGERQVGTVRLWEGYPDLIHIVFTGSKAGIPYPDEERIEREKFNERKDIWQIKEEVRFGKTLQYLKDNFSELENDYGTNHACSLIACDVARLLIAEGGHPQILDIRGRKTDLGGNTEDLIPRRYSGRVTWGGHSVCQNDNLIYDPMIGEPVEKELYLNTTFLNPAEATVYVPNEEMEEFLNPKK